MKRYEFFDHTAEVGVRAFGRRQEELFQNMALGMFDLMVDVEKVQPHRELKIEVSADNVEELLIAWLRELLYQCDTQRQVFSHFEISRLEENSLVAVAKGEPIDLKRHGCKKEVKAVTYYGLSVREKNGIWEAEVIFDI